MLESYRRFCFCNIKTGAPTNHFIVDHPVLHQGLVLGTGFALTGALLDCNPGLDLGTSSILTRAPLDCNPGHLGTGFALTGAPLRCNQGVAPRQSFRLDWSTPGLQSGTRHGHRFRLD